MKIFLTALLLSTVLLSAQSVKRIRRIYVEELQVRNNPDLDGLLRSKLISSLAQDCGASCAVVEDVGPSGDNGDDTADGVLTGSGLFQCSDNNRHCRIQAAMRLVAKDGTVVWAATIYSSPFARSASSSFADATAKKLTSFLSQAKPE